MAKVIVVDDSPIVINEVSSFLEKNDINVLHAADGMEGLEVLKDNQDIAIAIVDFNMPNMNGMDMIEKVRIDLPELHTAFIMLTTEFDRELKSKGKKLGVKGWIVKPFNGERAIGVIKKILAGR